VDAAGRLLPRAEAPYAEYREQPAWDVETLAQIELASYAHYEVKSRAP
jgi:hypothetical protein